MLIWLLPVLIGVSFCLTWALRRYALARSIIDVPNARSSHSIPTPRGGGVAIVLTFLLALLLLGTGDFIESRLTWALLGAGAGIAILGFLDDHGHIAARWRLLGHFVAAIWALFWLGGLPALPIFGITIELGWFGHALAAVYLVWLLNLYNFMDGIDGIASVEAICVCLGGALLYGLTSGVNSETGVPLLLAAAVAGFLFWNFPPARIFMGDRVYEAHRSHAYQYAARHFGSHLPVTLAVLAINVLWLLPVAIWVAIGDMDGMSGLLIAYAPLALLAWKYHAGEPERPV